MDALKEALKRKLMGGDKHPLVEVEIGKHDDKAEGEKNGKDVAPEVGDEGAQDMQGADQMGVDMDPKHMEILQALMDHGHGGRDAGGLNERVADKAKEKFASINKQKHSAFGGMKK